MSSGRSNRMGLAASSPAQGEGGAGVGDAPCDNRGEYARRWEGICRRHDWR